MDELIKVAADEAMKAAAEYIRKNNLRYEIDAMVACIRSHMQANLKSALHDAKEAFDANMPKVAEATFIASMRLAGIEAAKEASHE